MDSKQLHELMKASVSLDNSLTQLRDRIVDSTVPQHAASPSQWLLEASNTRNVFRTLAETLEANRNLVQLNKEKIEKSRVFLEGLEYYKVLDMLSRRPPSETRSKSSTLMPSPSMTISTSPSETSTGRTTTKKESKD